MPDFNSVGVSTVKQTEIKTLAGINIIQRDVAFGLCALVYFRSAWVVSGMMAVLANGFIGLKV